MASCIKSFGTDCCGSGGGGGGEEGTPFVSVIHGSHSVLISVKSAYFETWAYSYYIVRKGLTFEYFR